MAKRESLMLAHKYNSEKHSIHGWMMSQKIDGIRCIWDSGVTAGIDCREIPWANVEKDGRYKERPIATGLWTRYLKPIYAPTWWLERLPSGVCLDGELYSTKGWQYTSKVVKRISGDLGWEDVKYYAFDSPDIYDVFPDGEINIPQLKKEITGSWQWLAEIGKERRVRGDYELTYNWMVEELETNDVFKILRQEKLPSGTQECEQRVTEKLDEVLSRGGEGLMVRNPYSIWSPRRTWDLLKIKGMNDDEGVVTGYIGGKGKLAGLFGALVLDYGGRRFELSGFTDSERRMMIKDDGMWVNAEVPWEMGGRELGEEWEGVEFKRGDVVTFRYRELSDTGVPKEGRYWRKA